MDALMNLSANAIANLQGSSKSPLDKFYESKGFTVITPSGKQETGVQVSSNQSHEGSTKH